MSSIFKSSEVIIQDNKFHVSFDEQNDDEGMEPLILNEVTKENIDIINSQKEADSIIFEAEKEAKRIIFESELKAKESCLAAYEKGKKQALNEYSVKINEAINIVKEVLEEKLEMLNNCEKDILSLVEKVSKKVIDNEIKQNYISIKNIFDAAVSRVIEEDYEIISARMSKKNIAEYYPNNEIKEFMVAVKYDKKLSDSECIIETKSGDIDISFNGQLREITNKLVGVAG